MPHSTTSLCPHCDAELFPRIVRPAATAKAAEQDEAPGAAEVEAEAA